MGAGASVNLEDDAQKKLYEEMKNVYDKECKNGMVRLLCVRVFCILFYFCILCYLCGFILLIE